MKSIMDGQETHELGLFPLGLVALPGELIPLHIFEPRYRALIADCALASAPFTIALATEDGIAATGCTVRLDGLIRRFADGRMNIVVRGDRRVTIGAQTAGRPYLTAMVTALPDDSEPAPDPAAGQAVRDRFARLTESIAGSAAPAPETEGVPLSFAVAGALDLDASLKQGLLELRTESLRLEEVTRILDAAIAGLDRAAVAEARAQTNGKVTLE